MKIAFPEQLPKGLAELGALRVQADRQVEVFKARHGAEESFSWSDVAEFERLLEGLNRIHAVERSRFAHHEAGHAVVATLVGGQVATASVFSSPVRGHDGWSKGGECQCAPMHLAVEQSQPLIAAAGAAAEAVWEYGSRAGVQHVDARLVGQKDGEFLQRWALAAGSHSPWPTYEALATVRRCWPAVTLLASQIEERGEISHKHVVKALGLSNDHALHPFELSNIRAGLRKVSDLKRD